MKKRIHFAIGVISLAAIALAGISLIVLFITDEEIFFAAGCFFLTIAMCGIFVYKIWESGMEEEAFPLTKSGPSKTCKTCSHNINDQCHVEICYTGEKWESKSEKS